MAAAFLSSGSSASRVEVWADIYRDGHDVIAAALVWRREKDREWRREPMTMHSNDRWGGSFVPDQPGRYVYAIEAWTDEFATWRHGFELKQKAGADLEARCDRGRGHARARRRPAATAAAAVILRQCEDYLQTGDTAPLLSDELKDAMAESQLRPDLTRSQLFPFVADRPRARIGAWYEMVPRSQGKTPASTARSRIASRGCPMSPRWASTWFISRRSTRSATPTARAATTR